MDIAEKPDGPITEKEIVYLADKFVQADCIVPLETRFTEKLKRHAAEPRIRETVMERFKKAMTVKNRWETASKKPIESLLTDLFLAEVKSYDLFAPTR